MKNNSYLSSLSSHNDSCEVGIFTPTFACEGTDSGGLRHLSRWWPVSPMSKQVLFTMPQVAIAQKQGNSLRSFVPILSL